MACVSILKKFAIFFIFIMAFSEAFALEDKSGATPGVPVPATVTGVSDSDEEEVPTIQISEQELPRESVMPKLDTPMAVLNRKLSYFQKFQVELGSGWLLDEAFFNNLYGQVQGSYSWSEASAVGLRYMSFGSGLSDYGKQFESVSTNPPDFDRAYGPSSGWTAFYERKMMYGKLSTAKWSVIPAILSWDLFAGMVKYGSRQLPFFGASISNKFFLTNSFAIGLNVRGGLRNAVDPLSADLRSASVPAENDFKTTTKLSLSLDLGISYLF